jgi:hypothetical protein
MSGFNPMKTNEALGFEPTIWGFYTLFSWDYFLIFQKYKCFFAKWSSSNLNPYQTCAIGAGRPNV